MKKILFPIDFSEASINAFIYALKLADSIKGEIITLHIYDLPQVDYITVTASLNEIYDIAELGNFENYKDEIPLLRNIAEQNNLGHVKMSNVLDHGNLVDKVLKMINSERIDYVVMGTKGATGLKETFLGTATTKVMNDSKAIVFAIPEHCKYHPIAKILFLTKYNFEDIKTVKKVIEFAKVFGAHIDCLHVKPSHATDNDVFMEEWKKITQDHDSSLHTIRKDDVEGVILDFIELHKINMITMHVYHKNFFEKLFQISLSKKLAFHVNIPLLAIPE
ncbi:nucleotide-binding universal stress UspA family protein [Flavobacterium sp. CG_23.5]|uniref:universal stress protein n=1 Tax=Flavobacterium sp. CG_23.5 TaxID=2760708 RepID=UPI001AE13B3A|nr:universal stress protein [Flavobacterium sp. CG_23.5]MBP2282233.1 nucleotide-binding universal stress UspA family protein [Flavobacterium sp. CG_23.5]